MSSAKWRLFRLGLNELMASYFKFSCELISGLKPQNIASRIKYIKLGFVYE